MQKQIENEVKNSLLRKREILLVLTLGKNKPIIIRYWDILQKNDWEKNPFRLFLVDPGVSGKKMFVRVERGVFPSDRFYIGSANEL